MHISQIRIPGFGRLRGAASFETGRCNVLCQQNEFGKSTLMDAILYALYGFPSQRARNSVLKPKDKYKPWDNGEGDGSFSVEMDLTAPDGRPMQLIADFRKSQSFEL